jgi:SAM-dependent methyltransferase
LARDRVRSLLKTDLFDEAFGQGLYALLSSKAERVFGIDLSATVISIARSQNTNLYAFCADTRALPFEDGSFDVIVSNSTLDHFENDGDLFASLKECHRVLRDEGRLMLTLDNLANPVVALRQLLPFALLNRLKIVPYYVGYTLTPRRLFRRLNRVGFQIKELGSVMHCPRALAVLLCRIMATYGSPEQQHRLLKALMAFERLSGWATLYLTGYFIAAHAVKRSKKTS